MQQVSVVEQPLLMGDRVAGLLLEYAALLGRSRSADTVRLRVISSDGAHRTAHLLLNSASMLLARWSPSRMPEPDNAQAEAYLQQRIDSYGFGQDSLLGLFPADPDRGADARA